MTDSETQPDVPVLKDELEAQAIPSSWRPVISEIVEALVAGNYVLSDAIQQVEPVSLETARHITDYIEDYGETLAILPNETWATSVSQWMGTFWEVLIDLWTEESGPSDMVLSMQVEESAPGYSFNIHMVYVH